MVLLEALTDAPRVLLADRAGLLPLLVSAFVGSGFREYRRAV
jgi:hypothetical protein